MYHSKKASVVGSVAYLFLLIVNIGIVEGQNNLQFCDDRPCIIPLAESCRSLKRNNNFFGSCCFLEDIVGTGGCRVSVYGAGNCAWWPKCGQCTDSDKFGCGIDYQTKNAEACPVDRFNVLNKPQPATQAPMMNGTDMMNGTMMETAMPTMENFTFPPSMAPTCEVPTASPIEEPSSESSDDAVESIKATLLVMSLCVAATGFLAMM